MKYHTYSLKYIIKCIKYEFKSNIYFRVYEHQHTPDGCRNQKENNNYHLLFVHNAS